MKRRHLSLQMPHMSWLSPSSSHNKTFLTPIWPPSLRAADPCEERHELFLSTWCWPERVFWHSPAGHSQFQRWYRRWKPLHWDFSDPPLPVSPPSPSVNRLYLHSHQGLVMVNVLDNFLNLLKLFLVVASDFTKFLWQKMGEGKERNVSPSAKIDVWRILVSPIPLVYDGNRFLRFLY